MDGVMEGRRLRTGLVCLGLAVSVCAVYGQTLGFEFVLFDDDGYVYENPVLRQGLSLETLRWALTTQAMSNWHPLTWVSYLVDFELFGLEAGGYHLGNVILHLVNALLLFGWLRFATGAEGRSAVVAGLFALHPLHVESVAWVSERKDVLSMGFGLLSLCAYTGYARSGGGLRYGAALLCLALGLLAKPMLVTLPVLFLLLDHWPLGRTRLGREEDAATRGVAFLLIEKLPFFALACCAGVLTVLAQQRGGLVASADWLPVASRVGNAFVSVAWYLEKTLWPVGLSVHYPHPYLWDRGGAAPSAWQVAGAAAGVLALTGAVLRARRRAYLGVGWLWFLVALAPVIGLLQVSSQGMADRYTYLPHVGLFVAGVWGAAELVRRVPGQVRVAVAGGLAGVVLVACGVVAHAQTRHWRDSLTLFSHAARIVPDDVVVRAHLGMALRDAGRPAESLPHFEAALARDPRWPLVHFQRALAQIEIGELELAERDLRRALALTPDVPEVRANLAGVLLLRGRVGEAIQSLERVVALRPGDARAHLALGGARARAGQLAEAEASYRRALEIEPALREARLRLGHALGAQGRVDEAREQFERVLADRPGDPAARAGLELARRGAASGLSRAATGRRPGLRSRPGSG